MGTVNVVDVLAVYRLARLVAVDRLTEGVRDRVDERWPFFGDGLACVWCVSVWVAFGVCLLPRSWWGVVRVPLGLAGAAGVLGAVVARLEDL